MQPDCQPKLGQDNIDGQIHLSGYWEGAAGEQRQAGWLEVPGRNSGLHTNTAVLTSRPAAQLFQHQQLHGQVGRVLDLVRQAEHFFRQ